MLAGFTSSDTKNGDIPETARDISPLLIGEKIPEGNLKTVNKKEISLQSVISDKPAVLIFYRGGWCPYCNKHLAELQSIEQDILNMGYQIIAISPDSPEKLNVSLKEHNLNYTLYSDADMDMARSFGIAFQAPNKYKNMLDKRSGDQNPGLLPVPAVFVVNTKGVIQFEYINPDYETRISGKMLKAVLKTL